MGKVEMLWSEALTRPLLSYSDSGQVAIHLIYSKEQQKTREERQLSNRIELNKQQFNIREREYKRLSHNYEKQQKDLKGLLSIYNKKVDNLNDTFSKLKKDGISKNEKHAIKRKERQINNLKYRLDQKHAGLESLRKRLNQKTEQLKKLSRKTNELVSAYNEKFSDSRKFHQGQFTKRDDQQVVKIFQFGNSLELKAVLAHEMGHALGLNHVENEESVMYYLMDKQNMLDLALSKEDIEAMKNRCTE